MSVNALTTLPLTGYPLNNTTPFTYRDGHTFLQLLEAMRSHFNNDTIPHIDEAFLALVNEFNLAVEQMGTPEGVVLTVNGTEPDAEGNVDVAIPSGVVLRVNNVEPDVQGNVVISIPQQIHVGSTPPADTSLIWLDTSV